MIITYTPDDGEKQVWSFSPERLLTTEAEAIEKVTGQSYADFAEALLNGGITARRAVVWVMRKRCGEPELRFRDVDFPVGAFRLDLDPEEKALIRNAILQTSDLTPEQRAGVLATLEDEEDEERESPDPKAPESAAAGA